MEFDYPGRVNRLQELMVERGVDLVVLSVGADLPYFIGYDAMASERLTAPIVRPSAESVLFIPEWRSQFQEGIAVSISIGAKSAGC